MSAAAKFGFTGFPIEFDLILLLRQIERQNGTLFLFWDLFVSPVVLSKCKTLGKLYL